MTIVVSTAPAVEPVTVDEVLHHCRIDCDSYDYPESVLLASLIEASRRHAENELNRYLITQTLDAYSDGFQDVFNLPPMQSVTEITYIDTTGAEKTLATDQYLVDAKSIPSRITVSYGNTWPSTRNQNNAVKIRFVAGYGLAEDVPECIKSWMLMRIKTLYESRDQIKTSNGSLVLETSFIDSLLDPERVRSYL